MKKGRVFVVSGGQYGSEGKGRVAAKVVVDNNCVYAVRCGGTTPGHQDGRGGLAARARRGLRERREEVSR